MKKYKKLIQILAKSVVTNIGHDQKDYDYFQLTNFKVVKEYVVTNNEQLTFVKQMLPPAIFLGILDFSGSRVIELEDYQHHKRLILIHYHSCGKTNFYIAFDRQRTFKVSTAHSWVDTKEVQNRSEVMKMPHGIPYWIKSQRALVSVYNQKINLK